MVKTVGLNMFLLAHGQLHTYTHTHTLGADEYATIHLVYMGLSKIKDQRGRLRAYINPTHLI